MTYRVFSFFNCWFNILLFRIYYLIFHLLMVLLLHLETQSTITNMDLFFDEFFLIVIIIRFFFWKNQCKNNIFIVAIFLTILRIVFFLHITKKVDLFFAQTLFFTKKFLVVKNRVLGNKSVQFFLGVGG